MCDRIYEGICRKRDNKVYKYRVMKNVYILEVIGNINLNLDMFTNQGARIFILDYILDHIFWVTENNLQREIEVNNVMGIICSFVYGSFDLIN